MVLVWNGETLTLYFKKEGCDLQKNLIISIDQQRLQLGTLFLHVHNLGIHIEMFFFLSQHNFQCSFLYHIFIRQTPYPHEEEIAVGQYCQYLARYIEVVLYGVVKVKRRL